MSAYLLAIIGTVLFSALFTAILPDGKTSGLIKSIFRLVCVLAIIAPVLYFLSSGEWIMVNEEKKETFLGEEVIQANNQYIQYYSEMRICEAESAIEEEIFNKYGLKTNILLTWELETSVVDNRYEMERIKITKICVITNKEEDEKTLKELWEYLKDNYCSEVIIE